MCSCVVGQRRLSAMVVGSILTRLNELFGKTHIVSSKYNLVRRVRVRVGNEPTTVAFIMHTCMQFFMVYYMGCCVSRFLTDWHSMCKISQLNVWRCLVQCGRRVVAALKVAFLNFCGIKYLKVRKMLQPNLRSHLQQLQGGHDSSTAL